MKNKKYIIDDVKKLRKAIYTNYMNKYYNMFMHQYKWNLEPEEQDYIMKSYWDIGTVAAFKIKNTDTAGYTGYTVQSWNMYDFPENILLINKWNLPFIPRKKMVVNKDAVVGWIQANHKSIKCMVDYYVQRIVQVEMVINTNLNVNKMPFLIGVDPADTKKAQDILDKILNDELVIFMDANELNMVKSLVTATPYIIDKLYDYKTSIEAELLTYLGIDNAMSNSNRDRLLVDEVNSNNEAINANQQAILENLKAFADKITEVLGVTVTVEPTVKPVESVYDNGENQDANNFEQDKE